MTNETPQPSPASQTDALGSILVIVEGRENTTVRPTRPSIKLGVYPRPNWKRTEPEPRDPEKN